MVVNRSVPASTVPEFITYAKANPGKLNMASIGTGSTSHIAGVLFQLMTGVNMIHVPYRGDAPALTDLLGGQGYARRCFPRNAHEIGAFTTAASRRCGSGSAWGVPGAGSEAKAQEGAWRDGGTWDPSNAV